MYFSDTGKSCIWRLHYWHSSPLLHGALHLISLRKYGLEKIDGKPEQMRICSYTYLPCSFNVAVHIWVGGTWSQQEAYFLRQEIWRRFWGMKLWLNCLPGKKHDLSYVYPISSTALNLEGWLSSDLFAFRCHAL